MKSSIKLSTGLALAFLATLPGQRALAGGGGYGCTMAYFCLEDAHRFYVSIEECGEDEPSWLDVTLHYFADPKTYPSYGYDAFDVKAKPVYTDGESMVLPFDIAWPSGYPIRYTSMKMSLPRDHWARVKSAVAVLSNGQQEFSLPCKGKGLSGDPIENR